MSRIRRMATVLSVLFVTSCSELRAPALPPPEPEQSGALVWLDQNWGAGEWRRFHTLSQGTVTLPVPYEWFVALEAPGIFQQNLMVDQQYLRRFGFIFDPVDPQSSEDQLPVGFARVKAPVDPTTGKPVFENPTGGPPFDGVGFTCAACHTGEVHYQGKHIRIEGGPAMTDFGKFRKALGLAVLYTGPPLPFNPLPFRFDRFARRVLGEGYTQEQADALQTQVERRIEALREVGDARRQRLNALEAQDIEEGFGRIDAIGRIGDQLFGTNLTPENYQPLTAPVSLPHIWHTPWFTWVQYNGSIMQPLVRNTGEALGVSALVNLTNSDRSLYASTVDFDNLIELEQLLAGTTPFNGLDSPPWPGDILGEIDHESTLYLEGRRLYQDMCRKCHLAPARELAENRSGEHWVPIATQSHADLYLNVRDIPLRAIGTDPNMAQGMHDRFVSPGGLDLASAKPSDEAEARAVSARSCSESPTARDGRAPFGAALAEVTENTIVRYYDDHHVPPEKREAMNGFRPNRVRASLCYKARPLDGIWATAPYLHNGSVPNLYLLLTDEAERDATTQALFGREGFYVASREFDPAKVGFRYTKLEGAFFLDTSLPGNLNGGHEFSDERRRGVVGRQLTEEERQALIYYLKSL